MAACTFFGHRECPDSVEPQLRAVLEMLIVEHGVDMFYVGHQGQFDALVRRTLRVLSQTYPRIHYAVVLAYLPEPGGDPQDYADTLFPEGIETCLLYTSPAGFHPRIRHHSRGDTPPAPRTSHRAVSYTHLDVYKRQA